MGSCTILNKDSRGGFGRRFLILFLVSDFSEDPTATCFRKDGSGTDSPWDEAIVDFLRLDIIRRNP